MRFNLLASALVLAATVVGCGMQSPAADSTPKFIQSSANKAYLEKRDIEDEFVFGLNVIETKGFFSNAMNLYFPTQRVRLVLSGKKDEKNIKLVVADPKLTEKFMSFDAVIADDMVEVDFASAGNDVELSEFVSLLGGIQLSGSTKAEPWTSDEAPVVANISQDRDNVVADVVHTLSYTIKDENKKDVNKKGTIKVRIFLRRANSISPIKAALRTVGESFKSQFGFFGTNWFKSDEEAAKQPISRFPVDVKNKEKIRVYMKNFPSEYLQVGKEALETWNSAFGYDAVEAVVAPSNVDLGDPRYNVIRWFDGLDEDVSWAGRANMIPDPETGALLSANILINGSSVINMYKKNSDFNTETRATDAFKLLKGRIGNVPVVEGAGETPVVPFLLSDITDLDTYLQGYYYGTIAHEFGHVLGLRHNFKASTKLDSNNKSSSVMDYEPAWDRNTTTEIGSYDRAAVRWAYFDEDSEGHVFCTDDNLKEDLFCNQNDHGDTVNYTVQALASGRELLKSSPVALPEHSTTPMKANLQTALKILELKDQLPADRREKVIADISEQLTSIASAEADKTLAPDDYTVASKNVLLLKKTLLSLIVVSDSESVKSILAFLK